MMVGMVLVAVAVDRGVLVSVTDSLPVYRWYLLSYNVCYLIVHVININDTRVQVWSTLVCIVELSF